MNDNQIDTDSLSEAVALAQIKDLAGASTAEDALRWAQALVGEYRTATAALQSLRVVSVVMARGQVVAVQLPGGPQAPDDLYDLRDGLMQAALSIGNVARSARKENR